MKISRIHPDDPRAAAVESMIDAAFKYYGGPYWRWKYADEGGAPGIIVAAESNDDVVGCTHYVSVRYHLGGGRQVEGLMGGDLLVAPELRRQHIATELLLSSRDIAAIERPDAALVTMYTWRALGKHLEKLLGYTRLAPGFRQWSKRLNRGDVVRAVAARSERLVANHPRLADVDHVFRLEQTGSPPLEFRVGPDGFQVSPTRARPRLLVKVKGAGVIGSGSGRMALLKAVAMGQLRISGSLRAMREAMMVRGAYMEVLSLLRGGEST